MKWITVKIISKVLHSTWKLVIQLEFSALQWTLYGSYFTECGHWNCSLNELHYSEHYMEGPSQYVDTGIAGWIKCITVNIIWKVLHSMWALVLQFEWSALQWTLYGRYFTVCGHGYCCLKEVHYIEHYMDVTSQYVDNGIAVWIKCITVKMTLKVIHSRWTLVLQFEWSALQWHYMKGTSPYVDTGIAVWMRYITVNIICKVHHSIWTLVL